MPQDIAELGIVVRSDGVLQSAQHLRELERRAVGAETATGGLITRMSGLVGAAKALAGAYAVVKVADYAKDAALLAARYETLGVVMTVVGKNAGYTSGQMEDMARGLQKTGISMNESRQTLTRMTQAQLDLTRSSGLARVAQDAAVIGNINSSEAFQRMVVGIQTGQTEILRTIGINVSFEKSYAKLAQELHKTVGSLTEQEKTQARMNAVMEAGKRIAGTYEGAMTTTGKQINSLARYHEDLGVEIGKTFSPATNAAVSLYTAAIKGLGNELKKLNAEQEAVGSASREWERVITNDPFATSGERTLQARAKAEKAARQSILDSDKGRAERDAAMRQDQVAYENSIDERMARGPKERFAALEAQTGVTSANAALRNLQAEAGGNTLEIELARLAGERATKIAQYQATMANPDILPGVASAHTAQRAVEEQVYFEQVEQAKRKSAQETAAFLGKLDAEREQRALDQKQAMYDVENEQKLAGQMEARTVGGKNIEDQMDALRVLYAEAANYTNDRIGLETQLNAKLAILESQRLKKSNSALDGLKAGLLDYTESVGTAAERAAGFLTKSFKGMEDALSNAVGNMEFDLTNFLKMVRTEASRSFVVQPLLSGISGGGIASWFKGLFNADGNVLSGPGISALSGGIYDRPTYFGYDRHVTAFGGGGVLGEVPGRSEAVMPLSRASNGELGVRAEVGEQAAPKITFNVVNRTGQNVKLSTSKVQQGDDGTTVTMLLDLVQRNVGGLRTGLQSALGGV